MHVHLIWDDTALTMAPCPQALRRILTIREKDLDGKKTIQLWTEVGELQGQMVCMTYQGFWKMVQEKCHELGWTTEISDRRRPFPKPRIDLTGGFRFSQGVSLANALMQDKSGLIGWPTRFGKCLCGNTEVLMGDGLTRKLAKNIVVGDYVMGSDSVPKRVLHVTSGRDIMYRITPNKGDPWECTQDHILVLQCTGGANLGCDGGYKKGHHAHVRLCDYLKWSKTRKHVFKQVQAVLDLSEQPVSFDPYIVGAFLGDGHRGSPQITLSKITKSEVALAIQKWGTDIGVLIKLSPGSKHKKAVLLSIVTPGAQGRRLPKDSFSGWFRDLVKAGKTIPECYLRNSREVRLQMLAGLLDTDGSVNNHKALEITTKYPGLRDGLLHLCRSLGFRTTWSEKWVRLKTWDAPRLYYRFNISGDVDEIPFKTPRFKNALRLAPKAKRPNPLTTGFKVECIGEGAYAGMEIEGEAQEFVLGNFTITHNSIGLLNTCRAYPNSRTIITAPGADLVRQLHTMAKAWLPERKIVMLGGGSSKRIQSEDLTICSMDSLHLCDVTGTDLLIVDEPHAIATDTRIPNFNAFTRARRLGFGATLKGRFDQRDNVIQGLIGPVLSEITYRQAVAEGAICPIVVVAIPVTFDPFFSKWRPHAMKVVMWQNPKVAWICRLLCDEMLPADWQTLLFIKNEDSANFFHQALSNCRWPVAMAKLLTTSGRKLMTQEIKDSTHMRVLCSDIYVQGMTFSDMRALVNLGGGGPYTSVIQKPGRLAEIRPDLKKRHGVMVDFFPRVSRISTRLPADAQAWWGPVKDGENRLKVYHETGYDVRMCETLEDVRKTMKELTNA